MFGFIRGRNGARRSYRKKDRGPAAVPGATGSSGRRAPAEIDHRRGRTGRRWPCPAHRARDRRVTAEDVMTERHRI